MTEREIFLNALEREDPAARAAYLDAACAGRPALRRRVEELLQYHREDPVFLNVPAMEQLAAAEESLAFLGPPAGLGSLGRLDHYDVLEVVGRGSTGVVLKARDAKLQRVVAIKALAPRLAASTAARQRFVREAQAAAAVRDDNVVAIYAVSDDGPVPYLVMEYICGQTLEQRLRQGKAPDLKETLRIGMQLAAGLAAAHAQGLVHRDIKPANILLENSIQRVKITDFGLARVAADAGPAATRALAGTPLYMSPEQARGEPSDHRTDLFSLGSVLYALCAGRPPFRADTTAAVLKRVCADAPEPVRALNPGVPEWLGALIGKLHAKEASDRPASAREVADLLGSQLALLQQPPLAPPPSSAPAASVQAARFWRVPPSRRLTVALCLVGLLAALAVVIVLLKPWQRGRSEPGDGGGTPEQNGPVAPLELRREDIPPLLLALAGGGDPARAPPELAAVLGDGPFLLPRAGSPCWMEQSLDGKVLAVPLDEDVVLFATPTGEYLRSLKGPGGRVIQVSFTRDNRLLAATTWKEVGSGAVRVWDLHAGQELYTNELPDPCVSGAVVFSPDGKCLIATTLKRIHVWDARTGKGVQTLGGLSRGLAGMSFSPDGRRLAGADFHGKCVKVFDWDGAKLTEARSLDGHRAPVVAVVYSPDGKYLASGDEQGFKLWNAQTLDEIRTVETPAWQLAFTPDSRTLWASMTTDRLRTVHTFTRWALDGKDNPPPLPVEVAAVPDCAYPRLSRDGKVLFLGRRGYPTHLGRSGNTTYVQVIDTATGKERFPHQGHVAPLQAVAVSPNGRVIASAGEDQVVELWDLATRQVFRSLKAHTATVCGLSFSRDGRQLASGSEDGTIVFWDVGAGTEVRTLRGDADSVSRVQFSPDGRLLAAGGQGGLVTLWDAATGKGRDPLPGHTGVVRCVAFSPDGQWLASGGEDRTVLLHPLAEGRLRTFRTPSIVNDVAFSPDGRSLAAVGDAHVPLGVRDPAPKATVHLWDLETGKEKTWKGHTGDVHGLVFSPAGPLLATCAEDGTVRLWDYSAETPRVRVLGPGPFGGGVRAVAFTPDGRYLATANGNGVVYLLRVGTTP
jgi:WD40 repeat protein/tRNA A-37 threonylcarbamoyl transferase component Bud32